jgi:hypothetical protein
MSNYYYETIEMNVASTDTYRVLSQSRFHAYGFIYTDNFNPFNPFENLFSESDEDFDLITTLHVNTTYILVVTTHLRENTGAFSIIVSGTNNISLNHIGEYLHCFVNKQFKI